MKNVIKIDADIFKDDLSKISSKKMNGFVDKFIELVEVEGFEIVSIAKLTSYGD